MSKIKVIAFDLGGVLLKEKDIKLNKEEDALERMFGNINFDKDYFNWATKKLGKDKKEILKIVKEILKKIYELREPEIFKNIPKKRFIVASNHLSYIKISLKKLGVDKNFESYLISGIIKKEKPNPDFYEELIYITKEKPEHILFIDDNIDNIKSAKKLGIRTIHYKRDKSLTNEIIKYLKKY